MKASTAESGERSDEIDIEVVLATPERQQVLSLRVPAGCTARDAVTAARTAGLDVTVAPDLDADAGPLGIFGERVADTFRLRSGDRVELYRPLRQDPRERRRRIAAESTRGRTRGHGETSGHADPKARDNTAD